MVRQRVMNESVLVVGGAGYIGSCCAKLLANLGYRPVVYDNLETGWRDLVQFGPFVEGDVRNRPQLDKAFKRYRPKGVIHFAARSIVAESAAQPLMYWDNNVSGSLALLETCCRYGVERFVFSSSAAVYGIPDVLPIPLETPLRPVNPYGATKGAVEAAIRDVCRAGAPFAATCFRYFNAAGAHPDADVGERHRNETHLVPNALHAASRGIPVSVFGNDYETRDGTCIRDYIHVVDLARAHIAALATDTRRGHVQVFNLGTGSGHTVREILDVCGRVTGRPIEVRIEPRRPGAPPALVAGDVGRATEALHGRPERSRIDTIVEDAWRWQQREELRGR